MNLCWKVSQIICLYYLAFAKLKRKSALQLNRCRTTGDVVQRKHATPQLATWAEASAYLAAENPFLVGVLVQQVFSSSEISVTVLALRSTLPAGTTFKGYPLVAVMYFMFNLVVFYNRGGRSAVGRKKMYYCSVEIPIRPLGPTGLI